MFPAFEMEKCGAGSHISSHKSPSPDPRPPEPSQLVLLERSDQGFCMNRLGKAGIHACGVDFVLYILVSICGDCDDRYGEGIDAGKGTDGFRDRKAVHTGHDEIHEDSIKGVEIRFLKSTDEIPKAG